jgi:hypothetical protein
MSVVINGTTQKSTISTTEGKTAVDSLWTKLTAATALNQLAFSSALGYASSDWITLVTPTSTTVATTVNGSTTAARAAKYGTIASGGAAVYQAFVNMQYMTGLNAVIYLLVDDGNSSTNRPN